jgi:hypothetical protein
VTASYVVPANAVWRGAQLTTTVVARESGRSSTPRPVCSIIDVSGILGHPLSRVMTTEHSFAIRPGAWRRERVEAEARGANFYMFEQTDIAPVRVQGRFWSGSK